VAVEERRRRGDRTGEEAVVVYVSVVSVRISGVAHLPENGWSPSFFQIKNIGIAGFVHLSVHVMRSNDFLVLKNRGLPLFLSTMGRCREAQPWSLSGC
jgi:hypothetical protein